MESYVIITPCKNEAPYLQRFIDSISAQTVQPASWIVVDDGSTDATAAILSEAMERIPYLEVVRLPDHGRRRLGAGVVEAFEHGLSVVQQRPFAFVCKLDADLVLPPAYFELMIAAMDEDPRLGSLSGKPRVRKADGRLEEEGNADDFSVGMAKFYRRECLQDIGGLAHGLMWDGIDVHEARRRGWKVRADGTEAVAFVHLRPMGSSDRGMLTGRMRWGRGQYFMGTSPLWMLVSAAYRMFRPPYVVGGLAMLAGYALAWIRRDERYGDRGFRRYVRSYQHSIVVRGRARTRSIFEARAADRWQGKV